MAGVREVVLAVMVAMAAAVPDRYMSLKGKDTFQSSLPFGGVSGRAVDGSKATIWNQKSCTHTTQSSNPWWTVDLGDSVTLSRVLLTNREDCCFQRLFNFEIRVGDIKPSGSGDQNPVCATGGHPGAGETVTSACPAKGKYLTVRIPGDAKILTLCEVEVYAEETPSGGTVSMGPALGNTGACPVKPWTPQQTAQRVRKVKVKFGTTYSSPPQVSAWSIQMDTLKDKNVRWNLSVEDVTTEDFTLVFSTWCNTFIYSWFAGWQALPTYGGPPPAS